MTESQMRELVSATFDTAWRAAQPEVPLALENEGAKLPPAGDNSAALLTILVTGGRQRTMGPRGTRRVQRSGWIQLKFWTPANAGSAGAAALSDAAREILEMVSIPSPIAGDDSVTTQAALTQTGRHASGMEDGRWYMVLVRVPFFFFETK